MLANNYKVFGKSENVKFCWIGTIVFYITLVALLLLIPEDTKIPSFLIPLGYGWAARLLAEYLQADLLKKFQEEGGMLYNWKRILVVILLGILSTVILITSLIGISALFDI